MYYFSRELQNTSETDKQGYNWLIPTDLYTEADLELDQTQAEAMLKIFENDWLLIRSIFSTCQLIIYFY